MTDLGATESVLQDHLNREEDMEPNKCPECKEGILILEMRVVGQSINDPGEPEYYFLCNNNKCNYEPSKEDDPYYEWPEPT